jgi:hypothetical protein
MDGLPGALRQATGELEALGAPFTGERLALNPAVLPVSARREMAAACRAVLAGVDFLVHRYLDADLGRIADALNLSELETKLWDVCPEQDWALMARPDVVLHGGSPLVVDINAVSNAAFFSLNDQLLRAQHALPGVTSFLECRGARAPTAVPALARLLQRLCSPADGDVAICYTPPGAGAEFKGFHLDSLAHELRSHGWCAHVAALGDISFDDDRPRLAGEPVAVIYRFFVPEQTPADTLPALIRAATGGATSLFTAFRGLPLSSKLCLAFLSDDEVTRHFPVRLRQRLQKVVPWTRRVAETWSRVGSEKIDLLPWIERRQNDLVLKAANGHGGGQVVIGREVDPAHWRDRMTEATAGTEHWVVQQLIDPDRAEVVHWDGASCVRRPAVPAVYGAFLLERRMIGAIRRSCGATSTSLNINGSHGAVPSPVHWHR